MENGNGVLGKGLCCNVLRRVVEMQIASNTST